MNIKSFLSNWAVKTIIWSVIVVAGLAVAASVGLNLLTKHGQEIAVPDFTGKSVSEARREAERFNFRIEVTDSIYVRDIKRGNIVKQNPAPGSKVKEGRRILLTINARTPKMVVMPNLIGISLRSALGELSSRGLEAKRLYYVEDIATNNVLRQKHNGADISAGTMVASGSGIDLVLGLNGSDYTTAVPTLYGSKYIRAVEKIHDSSLNVGRAIFDAGIRSYKDSTSAMVYRQDPEPGITGIMGRNITIYLTLDEQKVQDAMVRAAIAEQELKKAEEQENL